MLIQSIYTHIFEKNERFYLYNSQSGLFCEISEDTYKALYNYEYSSIDDETKNFLSENKVLIPEDEKYLYYLESRSHFLSRNYNEKTLNLVIAPTIQCNFNCPYCFESKINDSVMTDEVEDKLIDFIKSHKRADSLSITWYGGEPLLAFNRIKKIWNRIKVEASNLNITYHSIITNGWLISDEVIKFFAETGLNQIQITLDGIKENHDTTRCLKNGCSTFDGILQNILKFAKGSQNTQVNIRVNISRKNADDYVKIFEVLSKENLQNISVYPGFIRLDTTDKTKMAYESLSSGKDCHDFFKKTSKVISNTNFMPSTCQSKGCMIDSASSYIIGPEGEIYKCWNDTGHKDRVVGSIFEDRSADRVRMYRYLNESSMFNDPNCKDCLVFPICSGGCGHYRYRNKFEGANFEVCTRFRDKNILEDSLLLSINS